MSRDIEVAHVTIETLRKSSQDIRDQVPAIVFGPQSRHITDSLKESEKSMRATFNSLGWWKLLVKVDDLGDDVAMALRTVWCRDLERHVGLDIFLSISNVLTIIVSFS
jgi:hypothetical protein